ncbi:MAG: lysoplasmalogenase [Armatimonadetes bacterium]|nr:lysoplasmalogenase [Armatimonadota bacterium]
MSDQPNAMRPFFRQPAVLFIGLAFLGMAGYTAAVRWNLLALRLACKPAPVIFMAAGLAFCGKDKYIRLIQAGLLFSAAGDAALDMGDEWFRAGLFAFLTAHLCYIGAYLSETRRLRLLRAAPFAAWGIGLTAFLWPGLEDMALPVALYSAVICVMTWRAAALIGEPSRPAFARWSAFAGAALFALSDSPIALTRFHGPVAGSGIAIMAIYWLGQLGIACSGCGRTRISPG